MLIKCFLPVLSHPAQYEHKDLLILLPYKAPPFRYYSNLIILLCAYNSNTFYYYATFFLSRPRSTAPTTVPATSAARYINRTACHCGTDHAGRKHTANHACHDDPLKSVDKRLEKAEKSDIIKICKGANHNGESYI